jgi:hypothetical protein
MISPLHSQKVSNDTCCVPCQALRNALEVKSQRNNLQKQLIFSRDSISGLQEIILAKDTTIISRDSSIAVYKRNELRYQEVSANKDSVINVYGKEIEKQRGQKLGAMAALVVTIFVWIFTSL